MTVIPDLIRSLLHVFTFTSFRLQRINLMHDFGRELNSSAISHQPSAIMDDRRKLLRHFLAALAYRTQKALRGAPDDFATFQAGAEVRTPKDLVLHMTNVLGFASNSFTGGHYRAEALSSMDEEVARFHEMIQEVANHLKAGTPVLRPMTLERLLQGPFADAMSHVGQLAMLRRLAGAPVAPENFSQADIELERLGRDQAEPASPDAEWPEAQPGWTPPESGEQH